MKSIGVSCTALSILCILPSTRFADQRASDPVFGYELAQNPTERRISRFAKKLLSCLKTAAPGNTYEYLEKRQILKETKTGSEINLVNFCREYYALRFSERSGYLERTAEALARTRTKPMSLDEVRDQVLLKVWSRAGLGTARLRQSEVGFDDDNAKPSPWTTRLGEHLLVEFVVDEPDRVTGIEFETLEAWKVPKADLTALALENLRKQHGGWLVIGNSKQDGGQGRLICASVEDYYATSHLIDPQSYETLQIREGTLAAVPSRESLMLLEPGDKELEARFLKEIQKFNESGQRKLCPIPMVYEAGQWRDWTPPAGHPHRIAYANLTRMYFSEVYAEQQDALQERLDAEELALSVSPYFISKDESTGEYSSFASWSSDADSLMPKADFIVFSDGEDYVGMVPWERAQKAFGKQMKPVGKLYPARYRTQGFPDAAQIKRLTF